MPTIKQVDVPTIKQVDVPTWKRVAYTQDLYNVE